MTDEFKDEIRDRMGDSQLQQTVSAGLFGIADADLFTSIVRETFPGAVVGGVTNDQIEGAVLRVGTGQKRLFKDEVEEMLESLGEARVSQSAWSVEARRWSDGEDTAAESVGQTVTVRVDGVQRILNTVGDDMVPILEDHLFERGWPAGANTPAFSPDQVHSVSVSPLAGEVVYEMSGSSIDASGLRALAAFPLSSIRFIASAEDPLTIPQEERIEMERAIMDGYEVTQVEVEMDP